ncbi:MAG: 50S ribosomal protein L9 [Acidobacteria bacterium]|nr:50S ribosomal protein L9 [Acidobacteriota bacterium]
MQIILREDVDNLGKRGDVVDVASGYARNYLLRRKLALEATPGNLKTFELQKEALALREQKDQADAKIVAAEIEKWEGVVSRKAGESGALFGSVTGANIAELLASSKGIVIDRRKIQLRESIKALGAYRIPIRLHRDVTVEFPLYVVGETQRESQGLRERQVPPPPVEAASPEETAPEAAAKGSEETKEKRAAAKGESRERAPRRKKAKQAEGEDRP